MSLSINDFKARLAGGGARANLFRVMANWPTLLGVTGDSNLASYLIKAASLPASTISPITIPFRGRQLQIAGDRQFEPWVITIINDNDFSLRDSFERWMNEINRHTENVGRLNPNDYMVDMSVEQLTKQNTVAKSYDFQGVWPSAVSAIDVSYDAENSVEEFSVELQVTYWTAKTTDQRNANNPFTAAR